MQIITPSYYKDFKCIADKCKNNCCIGWEIDIDEESFYYYKSVKGKFGEKLKRCIKDSDEPYFILDKNERCPFLNENNLCEIILNLGEDKICEICTEHPRYKNFFPSFTEVGIGLTCEEASRIIVNYSDKIEIDNIDKDKLTKKEIIFLDLREKIFEIINSDIPIERVVSKIKEKCNINYSIKSNYFAFKKLQSLERLSPLWDETILSLNEKEIKRESKIRSKAFKNILWYFIHRYLAMGFYDCNFKDKIIFSLLSLHIISEIYKHSFIELSEITRQYSSEIEYSDCNTKALLNIAKID